MPTYRFEKIPGGATVQRNEEVIHGVHPNVHSFVDVQNNDKVIVIARGWAHQISVSQDTVIIDETQIGGILQSYDPLTLTVKELQSKIMNVFNPMSNFIMP